LRFFVAFAVLVIVLGVSILLSFMMGSYLQNVQVHFNIMNQSIVRTVSKAYRSLDFFPLRHELVYHCDAAWNYKPSITECIFI